MIKRITKRFLSLLLVTVMVLALVPVITVPAHAATSGPVTGLADENIGLSFKGTADNAWSASGTQIVGSATGTKGTCDEKHYESTLTITNKRTQKATLSFNYAIEQNSGTIQVDGTAVTAGRKFSKELAPNASIKVYIKSGSTSAATKITMTNVALVVNVTATVTFQPAENGSYTVDGKVITEDYTNTQSSMSAYQVAATPAAGYQFMGWYNVTEEKYINTSSKAALNIESDCTITAKFASKSVALFETGGQRFADLNKAVAYAQANGQSKITLATDGSISGTYTIPTGITLLIPFDAAGTLYTTTPAYTTAAETQKAYKTLTMAAGSSITVNGGAISVGGKHFTSSGQECCKPTGAYGLIKMQEGSSIMLNNGANLYAWGYITGDGQITANSGTSVYEYFQVTDWRGGSQTKAMAGNNQKVFPFSQYYVQNIEAALTLNAGANEYTYISVTASFVGTVSATIPFVGSSGLFKLGADGQFTKRYTPAQDRMVFTISGGASLNSIVLTVLGISVDSKDYVLPINNNVDIVIASGATTIEKDAALLPGVAISIAKDAELKVAAGASLYVYDDSEWSPSYVWGSGSSGIKPVSYSPSGKGSRGIADAKVDVNGALTVKGAVYTTATGANITSSEGTGKYVQVGAPGTSNKTYQFNQNSTEYIGVDITPAKLHNADGSYTETKDAAAGTTIKYYKTVNYGVWHEHEVVPVTTGAVEPTLTTPGYSGDTYCSVCNKLLKQGEEIPKTGAHITWVIDGKVVAEEDYLKGTMPSFKGSTDKNPDDNYRYTFTGWSPEVVVAEEDATYTAQYSATARVFYTITFNTNGGEGSMEPQRFEVGVDTALNTNAFTRENYKFIGWNTAADGSGATYADEGAILELTGDMTLYAQWQFWNGWFTDVNGKQYYKDGELQKTGWTVIDGNTYYLDTETGYAATGITTLVPDGATEKARCVFDAEGVFQSDVTGVYTVGTDTYWLNSGIIEEEAGLKRVVKENGEVNYYYFAVQKNLEEREGLILSAAVKSTVLNGKDCWLHKTNGLALPEWGYFFDDKGVILHDEDTSKNGVHQDGDALYYYVDGIKAPAGMIKIGDDYYYANSKGQLIVNQTYYCSRTNGLMDEGTYAFGADGKLIPGATDKNGIVKDDDGVLRYYVYGKLTYAGLIELEGNFYYVNSKCEVVNSCVYPITWTHGLKEAGYYKFDETGKMIGTPKNGIVRDDDGVLRYYVNDKLTYAGLIKIGEDFYYVNSKYEVVHDCDYTITWTHDLKPQGKYHFDADGKLTGEVAPLKNGIYEEDGSLYFYRNGERAYAGLIQIDGDYYYVRSTCEVVHDRSYYVYWTHGLMPEGYYNFDSAGRMILDSETE